MLNIRLTCLTSLVVCIQFAMLSQSAMSQNANPVVVAKVIEAEVKTGQRILGTVHPLRTSTIGSAVDGRVLDFVINEGDLVKKGQTLAQLRTETLEIEQAAAKAELDLALQNLAELENGARAEDISEAEANMHRAETALKYAERELRRTESLSAASATTELDLDNARLQAETAQFSYSATQANYLRIKNGPRRETISQSQAQVELQRQRLNLIGDRIAKFTIVAPFDGFVAMEYSEVGAWITQGDPIAQIVQLDEVEIQAPVTAEIAVTLRKGDVIRVEFPELPNHLMTGVVDRIVPVANSSTRTFPVHIKMENKIEDGTPLLMAGMLARVEVPAGKQETLPLVPKDALVLNGNDKAVFVVEGQIQNGSKQDAGTGTVRKVNVELGIAVGDRIQVRGDVKENDLVVVVGNERLVPNSTVNFTFDVNSSQ